MKTSVWICADGELKTIEVDTSTDNGYWTAYQALQYMKSYNAWLNRRNPFPLRSHAGRVLKDIKGVFHRLDTDPKVITKIDRDDNPFVTRKVKVIAVKLNPPTLVYG